MKRSRTTIDFTIRTPEAEQPRQNPGRRARHGIGERRRVRAPLAEILREEQA